MLYSDAINYALDVLRSDERFADIDLSETSAFYNTVVLPFALMNHGAWNMNQYIMQYILFQNPNNLAPEQLDNIGKMLYAAARRQERSVTVEVTLFFERVNQSVEPTVINTTDSFRTNTNAIGYPLREHVLVYSTLPDTVIDGTIYKTATVPVQFADSGRIPEGTVNQTSVVSPWLQFVRNMKPSSDPINAESNEEYFNTIMNGISTRNDVNLASLVANYRSAFDIFDIFAIGYGDPEMQRDIAIATRGWSGHIGGRIDAFVKMPLIEATYKTECKYVGMQDGCYNYQFEFARYTGPNFYGVVINWELLEDNPPIAPLLLFDWDNTVIGGLDVSQFVINPKTGDIDYYVEVLPDPDGGFWGKNYRYSIYERLRITVKTRQPISSTDNTITLSYRTYTNLEAVQDASLSNRLLNTDLLFRSYIPVQIKRLVIVYDRKFNLDEELWIATIANRINTWTEGTAIRFNELFDGMSVPVKTEETWTDRDYLPYITDEAGNVIGIRSNMVPDDEDEDRIYIDPRSPSYALLHMDNIDGSVLNYISTRQLYPQLSDGLSSSYRTCRYFVNPENIYFKRSSW